MDRANPPHDDEPLDLARRLAVGLGLAPRDAAALEDPLRQGLAQAHRRWPGLELAPEPLADFVAERLPSAQPTRADEPTFDLSALRELNLADLYLACACLQGVPGAAALFEADCIDPLDRALGARRLSETVIQEVKQGTLQRLLVGDGDHPPALVKYSGRGALAGWVRVVATRAALKQVSRPQREVGLEEVVSRAVCESDDDPEMAHFKGHYRQVFKRAFAEAMEALPPRDHTLLRQQIVDHLSIDKLAVIHGIHRATAARQLAHARQQLVSHTRRAMMQQLRIGRDDYNSILRLIHSRIDLSLSRHLGRPPKE